MARERAYRHDLRCRRCGSNWMPKDGHTRGRQVHKCGDCKRKRTADTELPRFPEHIKRQAAQMRIEGASISASARVVGASAASVSGWVKKGTIALERMRAMSAWRTSGRVSTIATSTIALLGARKGEKRYDLWVWTAVVEERYGSRGIDFEVGGRDEATFLRLMECLPDAERYETDAYGVYGALPGNKHVVGKYGAVNWNEGVAFDTAREVESVSASDKGMRKERGYAGEPACASLLRQAQTQCHSPLIIPKNPKLCET